MKSAYKPLFTPWKIGNCEIKNRIVQVSMGGTSLFGWMEPNHFDKEAAHFLLERAKENVGLILPGIQPVKDPMLGKWLYQGKGKYKKLKEFMTEFHKTGAKLFIQIGAGFGRAMALSPMLEMIGSNKILGALAKPFVNVSYICASASPNPNRWSDKVPSRALTVKEIQKIIDGFARTAKLCQEAGVDGIEVHAVHEGYLLDQFTTLYTNQRTDEYGGSFENRYRFPVEIVKAIKKVCGKDFPVSLRYSVVSKTKGFRQGALPGETYTEVGRDYEESIRAAKYLQDAGYDMLNCDNGTYDAWYWAHPPGYMPDNCNLEDVEFIKKHVSIPVVCAGKVTLPVGAKAIEDGLIDACGFARQFLVDPKWVTKVINDDEANIKPCIHCHNACFDMGHHRGISNDQPLEDTLHMSRCALNPVTMQHKKYTITPAKKIKKVAIIGAGVGGMEAAIVLTKRGHKVTIYEKTSRLGGIFNEASTPSFKSADRALLKWYETQMANYQIDVKFNHEVKNINELQADAIIVATGAIAKKPNIKGIEHSMEACDYLAGQPVGQKVAIIGGGLSGCEIAYDLILKGKEVVVIEALNDLITTPHVCLANSSFLREMLAYKQTKVLLETTVKEIGKDFVTVENKTGQTEKIKVDSVIRSIGYNPAPLAPASKNVYLVGDANGVGNLRTVIWRAWDVALKI